MAFPPNYRQERNNRDKAKQAKAAEKLEKRKEQAAQRKAEPHPTDAPNDVKKED